MARIIDPLHYFDPSSRFAFKCDFPIYLGFGCRISKCRFPNRLCKDCNLHLTF